MEMGQFIANVGDKKLHAMGGKGVAFGTKKYFYELFYFDYLFYIKLD